MYTPVNPSFTIKKWGVMGSSLHGHVILMNTNSFNQLVTNGFSHPYHLDECTFNFRGIRSIFFIYISFFDESFESKTE